MFYYLRRFWWSLARNKAPLTVLIVVVNVLVYGYEIYSDHLAPGQFEARWGLWSNWFDTGAYWQPLTYAWLHDARTPFHLLFNLIMIFFFGRQIEWSLGPWRFAVLYLGGAIAGALTWVYVSQPLEQGPVIGASAAAFALLTTFAVLSPKQPLQVWILIVPVVLKARTLALALVGIEVLCWYQHWLPEIAHAAHVGGALYGWLLTRAWKLRPGDLYPADGPVSRL